MIRFHLYSFSVNFEANANAYQGNDIAFHFDIRFDQRSVVRNTRLNGEWGIEEIQVSKGTPAIPISKGQHFELAIFVLENQFKVLNYMFLNTHAVLSIAT